RPLQSSSRPLQVSGSWPGVTTFGPRHWISWPTHVVRPEFAGSAHTPCVPPWQGWPSCGSCEVSSAPSILPLQSLSMPSPQISTGPVGSHWYSQPLANEPSTSCQQSPGPLQSQVSISHCVLVVSHAAVPVCTHFAVPWSATQLRPQAPQFCASLQRSTPSSLTPLQSSSRLSHVVSSSAILTQ